MNLSPGTPSVHETRIDALAAELAVAAYRVALRTTTRGTWLDLELELWKALVDTLQTVEAPLKATSATNVSYYLAMA